MIIDTPGMRELGMWDISSGLGDVFGFHLIRFVKTYTAI